MSSGFLAELLTDDEKARLAELELANERNFVKLSELLGLDKGSAWRELNLCGTNFSDCDLRGFDFSGADLRGCSGRNIIFDATTNFAGAQVESSVFAVDVAAREILDKDPELREEYSRIKQAYWSDQHEWVVDALRKSGKKLDDRRALIMKLYFDTTDGAVRGTILQFLVIGAASSEARRDFFARLITDPRSSLDSISRAISLFGSTYRNDEHVTLLLLNLAEDQGVAEQIRFSAVRAALQGTHALKHQRRALALVSWAADPAIDNLYIRAYARSVGRLHYLAVSGGLALGGVDFRDEIGGAKITELGRTLWRVARSDAALPRNQQTIFLKADDPLDVFEMIYQKLSDLCRRSLPLKLIVALSIDRKRRTLEFRDPLNAMAVREMVQFGPER